MPNPDRNVGLRLALEVCSENDDFIYDVTDLVLSDQFEIDEDIVAYTIGVSSSEYAANAKTIVLTEGKSDSWIISESLWLLFPHLADYFSFMDFDGVRVGGGAGNLANTLRAFAGAGVVNRVIALFDNDTAAEAAIRRFPVDSLPPNMQLCKLPHLQMLESYPTIGPSGPASMDVNGMAAGLELYLGVDALSDSDGNLSPVQWTGYDAGAGKYQGEVLDKTGIQKRFRKLLAECRRDRYKLKVTDWHGVMSVLNSIFDAFHEPDGQEILEYNDQYFQDTG